MERVQVHFDLSEEQKREKAELVSRLLKEPLVRDWLIQYHLTTDFVESHSGRFQEWVTAKKQCEKCQGLAACTQPRLGKLLELIYDGIINPEIRDCRYLKAKEASVAHVKNYRLHHCSKEMLQISIDQIDFKKESQAYIQLLDSITTIIMDKQNKKGLYLFGRPGVGKTYLGVAITNYYAKENYSVAFVNVPELISNLKMSMNDGYLFEKMMNDLKRSDVVLFDDIGGESVTSWVRDEILLPIFNERMEKHRRTFFTSNYSMAELEEHFATDSRGNSDKIKANRLIERIKALSIERNMTGINRRV